MKIAIPVFRKQIVSLVDSGELVLELQNGDIIKLVTNVNDYTEKDFEFLKDC